MSFDFMTLTDRLEQVHSRRIALRAVALADAWPLYQATRTPQFNEHLLWPQPAGDRDVLERMDAIVGAARRGRMCAVSAVAKHSGEWMSLFRFQPSGIGTNTLEMGIWLHDKFWHGRYGLELGRMCVDAAFALSGVDRLVGLAAAANRGSCHLMASVGMQPTVVVDRPREGGGVLALQRYEIERSHWILRSRAGHAFDAVTFDDGRRPEAPGARLEPAAEAA